MRIVSSAGPLGLAALTFVGCTAADHGFAPTKENQTMLTCTPRVDNRTLHIAVELENRIDAPIWVAASLPVPSGPALKPNGYAAYVRVIPNGVLVVREQVKVPDHIDVEVPERPRWALVEPGETFRGRLEVPWPLVAREPYLETALPSPEAAPHIYCGLGYVRAEGRFPPVDPPKQQRAMAQLSLVRPVR